ncbi:MAG: aminotransferase class V-fold PLP-dependent enzyme [Bacteroidetes bacterium]|nr:MAG: aminotransferase class V-fold PLP-dependent enzyme [Bacteroidota bacterium]
MRKYIQKLEEISKKLEPAPKQRAEWNRGIQKYADTFLDNIETEKAYVFGKDGKDLLKHEIGKAPKSLDEILDILKKNVDTVSLNPASGGHLGYIPGGGIFPTAMGDYLAAITNRYSGIFFGGPGAVRIENQLIRWMCSLIGYPETALGNLSSGGSVANLIAIVTARDFHQIKSKDVENAVIYLTEQVHHCVHKAIRIAGLGEAQIRAVPMDPHFRMDTQILKKLVEKDRAAGLKPFLVIGSAGTTDTGAIDPLNDIADIAEAHDLWFHIDAAYGGFFILADVENPDGTTIKDKFRGVERSDSLAIDPHKGLFLSYGLGAVLVKNVQAQMKAHYYRANYMQDTFDANEELSPADLSPELTKHFRGLRMWLPLQLFGVEPFKACLEEKIWLTRYFYEEIQKMGFEVGPYPELSVAIYRYLPETGNPDEFNKKLVEYIHRDGRVFVSSTTIKGAFWIRIAILSFRTRLKTIDLYLEILKEAITSLTSQNMEKTSAPR